MRKEALCRIEDHWCTECCEGRNCLNLNQLSDKSWGCLGHDIDKSNKIETSYGIIDVFPILKFCQQIDCLDGYPIDRQEVKNVIKNLPPGEFFMTNIISLLSKKQSRYPHPTQNN